MVVLSRKRRESVVIGGSDGLHRLLKVTVLDIQDGNVRLAFEAGEDVPVQPSEEWRTFCANIKVEPQFDNLSLAGSLA